jgi:hypothetical protein
MGHIINNQEYTISRGNDQTGLDSPGNNQLKFGLSEFILDFAVFFQGKLFYSRFSYHTRDKYNICAKQLQYKMALKYKLPIKFLLRNFILTLTQQGQ